MASKSERGHAKNVDNFAKLIEACTGYGPDYKPAKEAITIASLTNTLEANKSLVEKLKQA